MGRPSKKAKEQSASAKAAASLQKAIARLRQAGLPEAGRGLQAASSAGALELLSLPERMARIHKLFQAQAYTSPAMTFFVFYDIENDRIRTHVAKYLIKMGCERVQKSVFLARLERNAYEEISTALRQIQEAYENKDSIMLVPVPDDEVRVMKVIGSRDAVDIVLSTQHTLFF